MKTIIFILLTIVSCYPAFGQTYMGSPAKWYEYQGILGADSGVKSKGAFVLNQNDTTTNAVTITQLNDSASSLLSKKNTNSLLNFSLNSGAASISSIYHHSEGVEIHLNGDTAVNIIPLDTTNQHVSIYSKLMIRYTYNKGASYTSETLLYQPGASDSFSGWGARNVVGGYFAGVLTIFFNVDHITTSPSIDHSYRIKGISLNEGQTWTFTPLPQNTFTTSSSNPDSTGAFFGNIIAVDSGKYYASYYNGGAMDIYQSSDMVNWGNPIMAWNCSIPLVISNCSYSEAAMCYFGNGKLLALARIGAAAGAYEQMQSSNNGWTWSDVGQTNIGANLVGNNAGGFSGYSAVSPWIDKDNEHDIIATGSLRYITNVNPSMGATRDLLALYGGIDSLIWNNPTNWTYISNTGRQMPNFSSGYWYPTFAKMNDSTWEGVYTDKLMQPESSANNEIATLFSISITKRSSVIENKPKQSGFLWWNAITRSYEIKNFMPGFIADTVNHFIYQTDRKAKIIMSTTGSLTSDGSVSGYTLCHDSMDYWDEISPGTAGQFYIQSVIGNNKKPVWLSPLWGITSTGSSLTLDTTVGKIATQTMLNNRLATGNKAIQTISFSSSITWNIANGKNASITLTGNVTSFTITGAVDGDEGDLWVTQDVAGGHSIVSPIGAKVSGGGLGIITLTGTANSMDRIHFKMNGTTPEIDVFKNYN